SRGVWTSLTRPSPRRCRPAPRHRAPTVPLSSGPGREWYSRTGTTVGRTGAGRGTMEDRIAPFLYLEMTDQHADVFAKDRVEQVLATPGGTRATGWTNCVPFRTDL